MKIERQWLILDIGCGTGILFDHIADKADAIVGLDLSKKPLLQGKERVRNEGLRNVQLIQADADNMPFRKEAFNATFAITFLQNTPNPSETLTEIKRVARNDAFFVITGLKKIFNKQVFQQLLRDSRLNTLVLEDQNLKCYVAICTNSPMVSCASQKKIRKS
jgi:ubiquinone/menaquinone biosynthesis C-methylase UbiE